MLAAKRQEKIVEWINLRGSAQVDDLATELGVSPMTIRRDLVALQNEGRLERCHGGAVAKKEVIYAEKQISHIAEKKRIAQACADFVHPGDAVFLDAGTTIFEIARLISDTEGLRIVTVDIETARLLQDCDAEVFICGGMVQKGTGCMMGSYARRMLKDFRFDVGFFGTACISASYESMTPTLEKMWLKRETVGQCQKSYLVADSSKFNRQAVMSINHLSDYSGVVTDKTFDEKEAEVMRRLGIIVIGV